MLRPWKRQIPDPHLSSSCAPLRLLISGGIKAWQVHAIEDMRELSYSQLHAEVAEADWRLELFGFRDEDPNVDRPDLLYLAATLPLLSLLLHLFRPKRKRMGRSNRPMTHLLRHQVLDHLLRNHFLGRALRIPWTQLRVLIYNFHNKLVKSLRQFGRKVMKGTRF